MNVSSEASVLMVMAGKDIDLLRYIVSSDPIWEASAAKSAFIEKAHAVIGLLSLEKVAAGKPEDMKLNREQWNCVRAEWAALRELFAACSLDATHLRRELRKSIGKGSHLHAENVMHRSPACRGDDGLHAVR
jgi:hypothetical protein